MRSFQAGLRASGKRSTAASRPTRMSTLAKSSKLIVPSSLTGARCRSERTSALVPSTSRALRAEAERAQLRLEAAVVADVVGAHDGGRARGGRPDVGALTGGHARQ